jgi:hypothetical protein
MNDVSPEPRLRPTRAEPLFELIYPNRQAPNDAQYAARPPLWIGLALVTMVSWADRRHRTDSIRLSVPADPFIVKWFLHLSWHFSWKRRPLNRFVLRSPWYRDNLLHNCEHRDTMGRAIRYSGDRRSVSGARSVIASHILPPQPLAARYWPSCSPAGMPPLLDFLAIPSAQPRPQPQRRGPQTACLVH